jgi:hypothetical protein
MKILSHHPDGQIAHLNPGLLRDGFVSGPLPQLSVS